MEREVKETKGSQETIKKMIVNSVGSSSSSSDLEEDIIEGLDVRKNSFIQQGNDHIICSNCDHKLPLVSRLGNYQLDTPEDSE